MVEIPFGLSKEYSDMLALGKLAGAEGSEDGRHEIVAEAKARYRTQRMIADASILTAEELAEIYQPSSVRFYNWITFLISLINRRARR